MSLGLLGLILAGCEDRSARNPDVAAANDPEREVGEGLTAQDQSNEDRDLEITRQIRQEITSADTLSVSAQNVKIITDDGVVTLRGSVESEAERAQIVEASRRQSGVVRVDDQLMVEADEPVEGSDSMDQPEDMESEAE